METIGSGDTVTENAETATGLPGIGPHALNLVVLLLNWRGMALITEIEAKKKNKNSKLRFMVFVSLNVVRRVVVNFLVKTY